MNEMDKEMLLELFQMPAPSGKESGIHGLIRKILDNNSISYEVDSVGNIFHFKEKKPLLMAHMDTVQDFSDSVLAKFIKIRENTLSGYGVIGGDDKCGIYIILHLLLEGYDINFAFTVEEETGGHGSRTLSCDREKDLQNSLYALILDRRGSDDIICSQNNYGTKTFEKRLEEIGVGYGFSPARGTFSDADQVNEDVCSANLSVGYYNPHSKKEFVHLPDLQNSLDFVRSILDSVNEYFEPAEQVFYGYAYGYGRGSKKNNARTPASSYYYDVYGYDDMFFDDEFAGANAALEDKGIIEECVFCGDREQRNLIYIKCLKKSACYECSRYFVEELKEFADYPMMSDEEMEAILDEFDQK